MEIAKTDLRNKNDCQNLKEIVKFKHIFVNHVLFVNCLHLCELHGRVCSRICVILEKYV